MAEIQNTQKICFFNHKRRTLLPKESNMYQCWKASELLLTKDLLKIDFFKKSRVKIEKPYKYQRCVDIFVYFHFKCSFLVCILFYFQLCTIYYKKSSSFEDVDHIYLIVFFCNWKEVRIFWLMKKHSGVQFRLLR